nr:unnamed protein product [Callosobruchus analis]
MISEALFPKHIFNLQEDNIRRNLIILSCVTICVWYLQTLWKKRNLYFRSWSVPGPLALPIIGSTYILLGTPVSGTVNMTCVREYSQVSGRFRSRDIYL